MYLKKIAPLLVLLIIFAFFYFIPRTLKISEIKCKSQFGGCIIGLEEKIKKYQGQSYYFSKKNINEVLSNDPNVFQFSTQLKFPNQLLVTLILEKPKYAIKNRQGFVLINKENLVISIAESNLLPTISYESAESLYNVGDSISSNDLFALNLLRSMNYLYQIKEGKVQDGSFIVKLDKGPTILFPLEGDSEVLIGSARLLISRLIDESGDFRIDNIAEVDLRFKNPVLR